MSDTEKPIETILSIGSFLAVATTNGLLYRLSHLIYVVFYHSNNDIRTI